MSNSANLECAINAIDQANQQDPNREEIGGESLPREYAYSLHMTRWLFELEPEPSERMQIACRAQHIERWTMPPAVTMVRAARITINGVRPAAACMVAGQRRSWRLAATRKRSANGSKPF